MKVIQKSLLIASLLAVGSSTTTISPIIANSVKASNINFGLTYIGQSVATVKTAKAQLYDQNGNRLSRGLNQGSSWKIDLQNTITSGVYYRVATNEFVKASDVSLLVQTPGIAENNDQFMGQIRISDTYDGLEITSPKAQLFDSNGNPLSRALNQGTAWKVGVQNNITSGTFYSVSNTEFVKATDVRLYQASKVFPRNEIVTIKSQRPAPIYDGNGQLKPGRALGPRTSWKSNAYYVIGKAGFYHVGRNEFVSMTDVQ